jgi:hypothetical protein
MSTRIIFTDFEGNTNLELWANQADKVFIEISNPDREGAWISLELETAIKLVKHLKREIAVIKEGLV